MDTLTRAGAAFRTRVMPREQAFSFAQALHANSQYRDVDVIQHHAGQWFVTYRPADAKREQAILGRAAEKRDQRAQNEEFEFIERPDGYWCASHSGNVYLTTLENCTCPDFEFRCGPVGLVCKHSRSLAAHLQHKSAAVDADRKARAEKARQEIAEIFGR